MYKIFFKNLPTYQENFIRFKFQELLEPISEVYFLYVIVNAITEKIATFETNRVNLITKFTFS